MGTVLERGDWKILIIAGVLLIALLGATLLVSPPPQDPLGLACSRSPSSTGAKATYLLLHDLGYDVIRWQRPEVELATPAAGTVLVAAGPMMSFSRGARQALRKFAGEGGTVLTSGPEGALLIPDGGTEPGDPREVGWRTFRPLLPSPLAREAPEVVLDPGTVWTAERGEHLALFGDDKATVVVSHRQGRGRFIWWASATPLTNAGLTQKGNLALLLNALGPAGTTVIWDEYSHGHRGSLLGYMKKTPLRWAMVQAVLLAVAVCLTFARRSGPVRPLFAESRLSPLEFVDTLGDLYRRAGGTPAAVEVALQRFRFLLARRLTLPAAVALERLYGAARQRLGADDGLIRVLTAAESAMKDPGLDDARALRLVQALHDQTRSLRLSGRLAPEAR